MIGGPAAGRDVVSGRVSPDYGFAPADIVVQAFIEANVLNRGISFVIDSREFYESSSAELEGDRAPRTKEVRFRMLPAGSYEVTVTVFGSNEQPRGRFVSHVDLW
jgi:hypothetical protein